MSLLSVVMLMTIVGMGIGLWRLNSELAPLRREVIDLRSQVGALTIDDDKKIHAVQVREPGSFRWNWRIWLPKGNDYWIFVADKVPPKGISFARSETRLGLGGQEINLRVQVLPNERGKRFVYMKSPSASGVFFEVEDTKWVNGKVMIGEDVAGAKSQVSSNVDDPLVLLRLSEDERSTKENPPSGLLIWISKARKP
jgi:hypothetical protein